MTSTLTTTRPPSSSPCPTTGQVPLLGELAIGHLHQLLVQHGNQGGCGVADLVPGPQGAAGGHVDHDDVDARPSEGRRQPEELGQHVDDVGTGAPHRGDSGRPSFDAQPLAGHTVALRHGERL